MEELVFQNKKGQSITTSLLVAEVFGKEHNKVCRDIENLSCSAEFATANFGDTPYVHPQNGQTYRMYEMTKDGFSFLVMGYTGERAGQFKEKFINEFNKRDALLKSDDYILSRALEISHNKMKALEAENQLLESYNKDNVKKLQEQAPKVLFADSVASSKSSILISELAKVISQNGYEIGQNRLFDWLRKHGYLCSKGEYHNQPTQRAIEMGLFEIKKTAITKPDGTVLISTTSKVTGKGQIYFTNRFLKAELQTTDINLKH